MIRQGRKKVPAGLRLFPKEDKYGHSDSIIRSSRIVCGAGLRIHVDEEDLAAFQGQVPG